MVPFNHWGADFSPSQGIAVGAGEIEEETVKELEDTRRRLDKANKDLEQLQDENTKLRARLTWLNDDDATIAGTYTESHMREPDQ